MINKSIKQLLLILSLLFAYNANAVILSLTPSMNYAENGDNVTLDLIISGLTDGGPDSLGTFDVDLNYDSTVLSFVSYTLSDMLGDVLSGDADDWSWGDDGFGTIDLAVESWLSDTDLDALQPDTFSLAEIVFSVDNLPLNTQTIVSIDANDPFLTLGDAYGLALTVDATSDAIIRNGVVVSEPSALLLMFPALLMLRRRRIS